MNNPTIQPDNLPIPLDLPQYTFSEKPYTFLQRISNACGYYPGQAFYSPPVEGYGYGEILYSRLKEDEAEDFAKKNTEICSRLIEGSLDGFYKSCLELAEMLVQSFEDVPKNIASLEDPNKKDSVKPKTVFENLGTILAPHKKTPLERYLEQIKTVQNEQYRSYFAHVTEPSKKLYAACQHLYNLMWVLSVYGEYSQYAQQYDQLYLAILEIYPKAEALFREIQIALSASIDAIKNNESLKLMLEMVEQSSFAASTQTALQTIFGEYDFESNPSNFWTEALSPIEKLHTVFNGAPILNIYWDNLAILTQHIEVLYNQKILSTQTGSDVILNAAIAIHTLYMRTYPHIEALALSSKNLDDLSVKITKLYEATKNLFIEINQALTAENYEKEPETLDNYFNAYEVILTELLDQPLHKDPEYSALWIQARGLKYILEYTGDTKYLKKLREQEIALEAQIDGLLSYIHDLAVQNVPELEKKESPVLSFFKNVFRVDLKIDKTLIEALNPLDLYAYAMQATAYEHQLANLGKIKETLLPLCTSYELLFSQLLHYQDLSPETAQSSLLISRFLYKASEAILKYSPKIIEEYQTLLESPRNMLALKANEYTTGIKTALKTLATCMKEPVIAANPTLVQNLTQLQTLPSVFKKINALNIYWRQIRAFTDQLLILHALVKKTDAMNEIDTIGAPQDDNLAHIVANFENNETELLNNYSKAIEAIKAIYDVFYLQFYEQITNPESNESIIVTEEGIGQIHGVASRMLDYMEVVLRNILGRSISAAEFLERTPNRALITQLASIPDSKERIAQCLAGIENEVAHVTKILLPFRNTPESENPVLAAQLSILQNLKVYTMAILEIPEQRNETQEVFEHTEAEVVEARNNSIFAQAIKVVKYLAIAICLCAVVALLFYLRNNPFVMIVTSALETAYSLIVGRIQFLLDSLVLQTQPAQTEL